MYRRMIEVRKGGRGKKRRLFATYAPDSSSPEKKGANDRRTGFTSFRALFAPLRTMFCRKKCFHFWTENIECVQRILSFCLLRESERIVPIPAFTFLLDFTVVDPIFNAICRKFYQNKTIMSNIVSPLICAVSVLFCSVSWVGGSTLFAQTETFYLSLFHLSQGYLIWGGGQGTM